MTAVVAAAVLAVFPSLAAGEDAPRLSDPHDRIARPDLSGLPRLRFLTTLDFPPFNFADTRGRAAGFNIDIARALCRELDIEEKCEIQATPWDELNATLEGRRGEAIIAGHRITAALRAANALSAPYFRFPARFVARTDSETDFSDMTSATIGRRVAVVAGSAHAAMLAAWFPDAAPVETPDAEAAYKALLDGESDLIFGDGAALSFWLVSNASRFCCRFVSGPFMSDHFLGLGMTIVMRQDSQRLATALNAGLKALEDNGVYNEIFARYFPLSPFATPEAKAPSPADEPREGQTERPDQTG